MFLTCFFSVLLTFILIGNTECTLQIQPSDSVLSRPLGSSLVLTCSLVDVEPVGIVINIQWFGPSGDEILDKTSGRDGTAYVDKSISLTSKLYITNIAQRHAGTYRCYAVVGGNPDQRNVTLQIFQDITFTSAPSPQTPTVYTNALILCVVTGNPIPNVYWKYRGSRLTSNRYIEDVFGLRISNITLDDEGLYYCCAEVESTGRYFEQEINVIVCIPPKITDAVDQAGVSSQEMSLKCFGTGKPPPKFEFYMNNNLQPVYSDSRKMVDGDAGIINFRPLTKEDEASYLCRAFNTVGNDSKTIFLRVYVPPTIYSVKNVTQTENLTTTLICLSYGDPPPDMTYRKEGLKVDYAMGLNVVGPTTEEERVCIVAEWANGTTKLPWIEDHSVRRPAQEEREYDAGGRITLTNPTSGELDMEVRDLEPDDTGNYTCKSRNLAGYHERNGTIIVNYSPRFHPDNPRVVYSWAGKTRNITCQVLAQPVPVIEWWKGGRQLQNNETYRIDLMGKNSNLQVTIRQYDEIYVYAIYTCRARNQLGTGNLDIELRKAVLPGPPTNVTTTVTPTTIWLSIQPPNDLGGTQLLGYWVQFELRIVEFVLGDPFLIEYVRPSVTYSLLIRARTEVGLSNPPLTLTVRTADISVPYPIIITSDPVGVWPYQFIVTWQRPETGGFPIREFEFRMRRVEVFPGTHELNRPLEGFTRRIKETDPNAPLLYYILQGLLDASYYQLEIRALNDIGWSLPNPEYIFSTIPDPLGLTSAALLVSSPHQMSLFLSISVVPVILNLL